MSSIWPLASITFKEGVRNRAFYGISLLALILCGANFLVSGAMITHDVAKGSVDIALSSVSFSGLLVVLFIGINLMAKDLDRRTIYMVLSRTISRPQYILGKFLGMVLIIVAAVALLSFFAFIPVVTLKILSPDRFLRFSWPLLLLSVSFTTLMLVMLAALSFLFASFTSSSFTTLILTVIAYIIGQSLNDVKALVEAPQAVGITVSPVTVKAVQIAYYLFPNLSFFDIKTQAAHGLGVSTSFVLFVSIYGVIYTALAITLAALLFRKKEFP